MLNRTSTIPWALLNNPYNEASYRVTNWQESFGAGLLTVNDDLLFNILILHIKDDRVVGDNNLSHVSFFHSSMQTGRGPEH